MEDLTNRTAIVTGSSAGVGLGIATVLAERGARVAIVARRPAKVEETVAAINEKFGNDRAIGIVADVGTPEGTKHVVEEAFDHWKQISILVNNAGRPAHRPFGDSDDEEWQADFELKLMAFVRLSRLVHPIMKSSGNGRIINILSAGAKVFSENGLPTTVTRAGGLALTKVLSKEFAKDNILVNAIVLGFVKSDQWIRRAEGEPGRTLSAPEGSLEKIYAELGQRIPLGRVGEPEEIGELVSFLVSDRARYITGTAINCDGGLNPVP